jgi:hypothetical protein
MTSLESFSAQNFQNDSDSEISEPFQLELGFENSESEKEIFHPVHGDLAPNQDSAEIISTEENLFVSCTKILWKGTSRKTRCENKAVIGKNYCIKHLCKRKVRKHNQNTHASPDDLRGVCLGKLYKRGLCYRHFSRTYAHELK